MKKNNWKNEQEDSKWEAFVEKYQEPVSEAIFTLYDQIKLDKNVMGVVLVYTNGNVLFNSFDKTQTMSTITTDSGNAQLIHGFVITNTNDDPERVASGIAGLVWQKLEKLDEADLN